MMLLRCQLVKRGLAMGPWRFSTVPKSGQPKQPQIPNPFKHKTYFEISKIMSLNISQKNQIIFCSLVLKTALQRIENRLIVQQLSATQQTVKEELINKTLDKMLQKLDALMPEDIYLLVKVILLGYENRYFRLAKANKDRYKHELQNRLAIIVEQDKTGTHRKVFKNILFLMLKSKKRINILKQIIEYLTVHDFKTNQQMLQFFTQLSYLSRTGYYDSTVEPLVAKFLDPKVNNVSNANEWVKPIVLEIVYLFTQKLRIRGNQYFQQFLVGLQHQFQNNRLQINDEALIFRQLLIWAQFSSPYLLRTGQVCKGVRLIYAMMKDLAKRIQQNQKLGFDQFIHVIQLEDTLKQFTKISHGILGKEQMELEAEFRNFLELVFQNILIKNLDSYNSFELVSVLNTNFQPPLHINHKLVRGLVKTLEKEEELVHVISRLRVYQYIVSSILEGKTDVESSAMEPLLRKIEKNSHLLKEYEIIRVYNMFRLLKIESTVFENLFKYQLVKRESVVIQNMARTYLKAYSVDIIKRSADSIIRKYNQQSNDHYNETNLRQIMWSSLKRVKAGGRSENRDPIYSYWVDENWQFFCSITKKFKICYLILSNAIKQFSLRSKGINYPINYEILLDILKTWSDNNPNARPEDWIVILYENLKHFVESENITRIMQTEYRHSFFVKLMWSLVTLNSSNENNIYSKRHRQICQAFIIVKLVRPSLYRERPNLQTLMILRYINTMNLGQQLKLRVSDNVVNALFWSYYHNVKWTPRGNKLHVAVEERLETYIKEKLGNAHLLEYYLAENKYKEQYNKSYMAKLLKNNSLLLAICEDTLAADTQIDENDLLDSFVFPKTLCYLFDQDPKMCAIYVGKMLEMKSPLMQHKIMEAANLVQKIKKHLSLPTRRKLKKHLNELIVSNFKPSANPSAIPLYLYFNLEPNNPVVLNYIKEEIWTNNYFLAQVLYINGCTGIEAEVDEMLKLLKTTRVLDFMGSFKAQFLILVNGLLGLSLNQKDTHVLEHCLACITGERVPNLLTAMGQLYAERQKDLHEFFILVSVALTRLDINSPQRKTLHSFQKDLLSKNPRIKEQILEEIRGSTCSELPNPLPASFSLDPGTGLPMHNSKTILIDKEQPGYSMLVKEYLEKFHGGKDIEIVDANEVDLRLGVQSHAGTLIGLIK